MKLWRRKFLSRNLWSGIFFGLGLVAFLDEAIFHQILHWHHFYDKSTLSIGLISDGLFHALSWFATIGGLFLLADLRRRNEFVLKGWIGAVLLGGGAFQLYDGLIQHKLMKIHQIRYVENVIIYDLIWNFIAIIMILSGLLLIIKTGKSSRGATDHAQ
ncbi:DUF2243 domain-containing protein [Robertmurraya sp. DFI.2.37]|uniref:DUF2243 domain-containing protein n=1 Tax=Robertmurraya sp. DFI.2.37 TaxID=3031819 RepID=UPI0023DC8EA3|nr:DUF2243 domain-containing protein [Robertmurraya sp. DFI.2.37]MDF1510237.1 DUF2243 domain-containing protein [Robertmurraya sp. DFI.2.37]